MAFALPTKRRLLAIAIGLLTVGSLLVTPNPASARDLKSGHGAVEGTEADPVSSDADTGDTGGVCDVLMDLELINVAHTHGNGEYVDHSVGPVVTLDTPIPAGRVLTNGQTYDVDHFGDEVDFTVENSQFEEQVQIRFLNAAGDILAETDPTPDLPDATLDHWFAVPSVDIAEAATAIQVVHGATGTGHNSIGVSCLNFVPVGPETPLSDLVQFGLCPIDGQFPLSEDSSYCGFFAVPENRDVDGSRHINIAFAVALGDGSQTDPLVYLEGGPGGAPISAAGIIHDIAMGPVSGGRDVIYVDQRGTGYSQPNLNCFQQENYAAEPPEIESQEEFDAYQEALIQDCYDRLVSEGIDLNGYTTVQNGEDIADLRIALGYAEWNLFGGSYGTDLALTVMRDRPEGLRSVVLDSVFPPEVNPAAGDDAVEYLNRLQLIADRCSVDPACAAAYPDLRNDIIKAVDNLNAEPLLLSGTAVEFLFGPPEIELDGFGLQSILDFDIANPYLAGWINGLASDDSQVRSDAAHNFLRNTVFLLLGLPPEISDELRADYRGVPGPGTEFSDGFFLTVVCAEEYPFETGAAVEQGDGWSEAIYDYAAVVAEFFALDTECSIFDLMPEDPIVNEPVVSDIETLVIYTDTDFQTPPAWSELTASHLTNVELVFFPQLGHVVTFYDVCPQFVVYQFLNTPGGLIDTSCADELPAIRYEPELPVIAPLPPIDEFFEQLDEIFGVPEEGDFPEDGPPPGEEPAEEVPGGAPDGTEDEPAEPIEVGGPSEGGPTVEDPAEGAEPTEPIEVAAITLDTTKGGR